MLTYNGEEFESVKELRMFIKTNIKGNVRSNKSLALFLIKEKKDELPEDGYAYDALNDLKGLDVDYLSEKIENLESEYDNLSDERIGIDDELDCMRKEIDASFKVTEKDLTSILSTLEAIDERMEKLQRDLDFLLDEIEDYTPASLICNT